jgi:acetate kinase
MPVLVINCGSSSLKVSVVNPVTGLRSAELAAERLGSAEATITIQGGTPRPSPPLHAEVIELFLPELLADLPADSTIQCVGHRVVHGGVEFTAPVVVDDSVVSSLEVLSHLAPLHMPANIAGIRAAQRMLPDVPHVAVFDTAFHSTIPRRARAYAVPQDLAERHDLRRYGFHGTSHEFVAQRASRFLHEDVRNLRIVSCHLGGGCSVCAIEYGRSIETSMGMTPLEGLVMGTRSGDIDPGALIHLIRTEGYSADQLDELLNRKSGLAGLSQQGSDLRDIERQAELGDDHCRLAIQVFCHRLRKYIGAYAAVMGGVDAIVFTAGIGQNSAVIRHRVAQRLGFLGARLDEDRNRDTRISADSPVVAISADHSRVHLLAVQTDEAWAIARHAEQTATECDASEIQRRIPVAISARHLHLTQPTVERLFGPGHQLTPFKSLSQPGQFAAEEQVTLVGPKRQIEHVRILGPTRSKDQVEISRTDEFFLGLDAPVRASGDVENSPGITIQGTEGRKVTIENGVICAWRHVHMTPTDADYFGVSDGDAVDVEVGRKGVRSLTFGDVLVRIKPSYRLEMHIDTDEGNAADLARYDYGELDQTGAEAVVSKVHHHGKAEQFQESEAQ